MTELLIILIPITILVNALTVIWLEWLRKRNTPPFDGVKRLEDELKIQQNSIVDLQECYVLLKKRIELEEEIEKVTKAPKVAKRPIKTHDADIKSRIVEALGQSPEGLSMNRLSKRTGSAMRTVKRHAQIMEKEGMLSLEKTKGLTLVRLKGE
jgi:hypothetical protein